MKSHVAEANAANFHERVIERSHRILVLVDFWAEWCAPCRSLAPLLEKVVASYGGRVELVKIDSDREPDLAARYRVRSIPNVKAFADGAVVDEFSGALPEGALRQFIERWLPSPAHGLLERALVVRRGGAGEQALALLDQALEADPGYEAAVLEKIDLLIELGRTPEASTLLEPLLFKARDQDRTRALQARLALQGDREGGEDQAELERRVAARDDDLDARLALARRHAGLGRWSDALRLLLEIVRRDRSFGDDIGRRTMLDVFTLMPPDHPELRAWRARLAQTINR